MSTAYSHASPLTGAKPAKDPAAAHSLAAMLLAAAIAALVVLANQLIDAWADGHLLLGWVTLWVVVFAGMGLFAGGAKRIARRAVAALDDWSRAQAQASAQARQVRLATARPRVTPMDRSGASCAPTGTPEAGDFTQALAPLGMDADLASPAMLRRMAQRAMQRHSSYLPYL